MKRAQSQIEYFWQRVNKTGEEDCWEWRATKDKDGYGQLRAWGRGELAHRVSWILHNTQIPEGLYVLHKCDNPACVNPSHLFLGDAADNMHDALRKKRRTKTVKIQHELIPQILEEYQLGIRTKLIRIVTQELADKYKVSWFTIRGIVNGYSRTVKL